MTVLLEQDRLANCCRSVREALLDEISPSGHWEGELSTSALSTATAAMALEMMRRHGRIESVSSRAIAELIDGGVSWLADHQNDDGGWGDTVQSLSNISTTFLARAVFRATGSEDRYRSVVDAAIDYIDRAGGVPAVIARYGKDRTFSIPILTHSALAGLVDWNTIPRLPFELACVPSQFYKTVRLPVVSYALPALIAIGQVRHHYGKPWNPVTRSLRALAREPSLRVLERIQPSNGGFLEATPLTSFVTMSLAGMGLSGHPVAERGIRFIVDSVRADGSWPIDTNLATWVTTLAVNALDGDLPQDRRESILHWLLEQQYKTVHPYTNAAPGGWAWTDLPGGVPDADDTPGAILAILNLLDWDAESENPRPAPQDGSTASRQIPDSLQMAIENGTRWLLDLQNLDGGFPTFCRGWGKLPVDRSSPDITAHALRALIRVARRDTHETLNVVSQRVRTRKSCTRRPLDRISKECERSIVRGFEFLGRTQRADGAWLPLWFGNQHHADEENPTYGTAKVLAAYRAAEIHETLQAKRGCAWLRNAQNRDGGWGAGPGTPSSVEETALAVESLCGDPESVSQVTRGLIWLMERVEDGSWRQPSPIGFYFAKLWYFERLYPVVLATAALHTAHRRFGSQPETDTPGL